MKEQFFIFLLESKAGISDQTHAAQTIYSMPTTHFLSLTTLELNLWDL